jgi:hypothetical protein
MKRFLAIWLMRPFWANPYSSIYDLILQSTDWTFMRRAHALAPGFPREDPVEEPPVRPVRPLPTDVPIPDPKDVPPPNPGKPIRPVPRPPDPKPRPTP